MSANQNAIPLGFAQVSDSIYRSAYPKPSCFSFLLSLKLKSVVCVSPRDLRPAFLAFLSENDIKLLQSDVGVNQEPFLAMSSTAVADAIQFVLDPANQPVLIFCTNGKVKTSCVVGCLRKRMGWSIVSIIHEVDQNTDPDGCAGLSDYLYIENF